MLLFIDTSWQTGKLVNKERFCSFKLEGPGNIVIMAKIILKNIFVG